MATHSAFFYGTLMAREVLYRVIYGRSTISSHPELVEQAKNLTIRDAILYDHCRHRVRYADYPGMIAQPGTCVRGTLVTGLTDNNMRNLDLFEGGEYVRLKVYPVLSKKDERGELIEHKDGDGEVVGAETYIFTGGNERLDEAEWDYAHFREEKLGNWADGSGEYSDVDAVVQGEYIAGDPTGGRGILKEKLESAV